MTHIGIDKVDKNREQYPVLIALENMLIGCEHKLKPINKTFKAILRVGNSLYRELEKVAGIGRDTDTIFLSTIIMSGIFEGYYIDFEVKHAGTHYAFEVLPFNEKLKELRELRIWICNLASKYSANRTQEFGFRQACDYIVDKIDKLSNYELLPEEEKN